MNIQQARHLKKGNRVQFPSDRGGRAGVGKVQSVDCATSAAHTNIHGVFFIWVSLGEYGVWPSHRLTLPEALKS